MLAAGAVFLSCCRFVRSTGYGLAPRSISEWIDIWLFDCLLTQILYRNGCMGLNLYYFSILGPKFRTSFLSGNRALTDRHTFI